MKIIFLFFMILSSVSATEIAFPSLKAQNIEGDDFKIPEDLKGNLTWLILGFTKASSKATTDCANKLEKEYPGRGYSAAVLEGVPFFVKGIVKNGIRSTIPADRKNRYLFLFEGKEILQKLSEFDPKFEDDAYIVGLKSVEAGKYQVIFKSHGICDENHHKNLRLLIPHANDPIEAITDLYRAHLAKLPIPPFSKSLELLLARNKEICSTLSRGDDICGFGVNGDIFLSAQEISPDLNFSNLEFKAKLVKPNLVKVFFTVWPGNPEYKRNLSFKFVKENEQWLVDDILYDDSSSMRYQITTENNNILKQAKDVQAVLSRLGIYLKKPYVDRLLRFFDTKVELCTNNKCESFDREDKKVEEVIHKLHAKKISNLKSGDPFVLVFKNSTWWVTKINH